jgi:uncharacterized membrane protein
VLSIALVLAAMLPVAPSALAAQGLTLTTAYPALTVSPGTTASFDLKVQTTAPARINLALSGVPASWSAELHGGGFVISAVQTDGKAAADVRLDVDIPEDATGSTQLVVTASDSSSRVTLPLDIKVEANAGGTVTVTPDYPALRGAADQPFNFNLTVRNQKEEDLSFTATGTGPTGWKVDVTITGQAQAVSGTVKAGATATAQVKVTPDDLAEAGTYPIQVVATVGGEQFPVDLNVEITGRYGITLSTSTQALSNHGPAGSVTEQSFVITNTGTAPLTDVVLSVTPPSNWTVTFDKEGGKVGEVLPGTPVTVIAKITPAGAAISGDYSLNFSARAKEANASAAIRFTVEASLLGAVFGGLLIIAAIGGLFWVFQKYGRR